MSLVEAARSGRRPTERSKRRDDRLLARFAIDALARRHAVVASDLSTQIHGELHTSQLGTFSGGICQ